MMQTIDVEPTTEQIDKAEEAIASAIASDLKLWCKQRRLLERIQNALRKVDGKTITTAPMPPDASEAAGEMPMHAEFQIRGPSGIPEYRSKRRSDRVPRYDSSQLDPSIEECERAIEALDDADTYCYRGLARELFRARAERERNRQTMSPNALRVWQWATTRI